MIEEVITLCAMNTSFAWAYYFFDGRDAQKQKVHEIFIQSLIGQIWDRCDGRIPSVLADLYKQCDNGHREPSMKNLQATLLAILHGFDRVFLIIDSLDECQSRVEFLPWLKDITKWKGGKLHLAVTGRPERDIVDVINSLDRREVCVDADTENADIQTYLNHQLQVDTKLSRWSQEDRDHINNVLTKKAEGMYVLFLMWTEGRRHSR